MRKLDKDGFMIITIQDLARREIEALLKVHTIMHILMDKEYDHARMDMLLNAQDVVNGIIEATGYPDEEIQKIVDRMNEREQAANMAADMDIKDAQA